MPLLALPYPVLPISLPAWFWLLLPWLAGRSTALPQDMEDWQLRDLNITRPQAGPGHPLHYELP